MSSRRVLVAGAGIGGLTLACALRRQGVEVTVLERASELSWAGAGISVQRNALTALRTIGLDEAVAAAGQSATRSRILAPDGEELSALPMDRLNQEFGSTILCIHRARLQEVLRRHAGEGVVQTGRGVVGFEQDQSGVTVRLSDGTEERGDLLVGADGLHSAVRRLLVNDGPPHYAGYTSWRGVAPSGGRVEPGNVSETWGAGLRFGIVSIGFGEVYWFAVADAPAGGHDDPGQVHQELVGRFGHWHAPIRDLIEATPAERIIRTDICDRPALNRWVDGRVVLLGDAAHPMTPNMGQGGCQAIEDAVVLADSLVRFQNWDAALARYQERRVERANWFVTQSQRLGQVAQWSHPVATWARDAIVRATPSAAAVKQLRTVMRFEI